MVMINHPQQRRIYDPTLCPKRYKVELKSALMSLKLEWNVFSERGDIESCMEIEDEYAEVYAEFITFRRAEKRQEQYHIERFEG